MPSLLVRVRHPDGRPAEDLTLGLEGGPFGLDREPKNVTANEQGECRFEGLPEEPYVIRVIRAARSDPNLTLAPIRVETLGVIEVETRAGAVVSGRVSDGEGVPIKNAEVRFESDVYPASDSAVQSQTTDAQGLFGFPYPILPGPLRVTVTAMHGGRFVSKGREVEVRKEPEVILDLAVE